MNDIDKIVQIFQSGEYQLAIQLANGIGMTDMDLLMYIWNNESEYYDEESDDCMSNVCVQNCIFGTYTVMKDYCIYEGSYYYEYLIVNIEGCDWYFDTLNELFNYIIQIINHE